MHRSEERNKHFPTVRGSVVIQLTYTEIWGNTAWFGKSSCRENLRSEKGIFWKKYFAYCKKK